MGIKTSFKILMIGSFFLALAGHLLAQEPFRAGTTIGNFLEIGYGGEGIAMGDAVVSLVNDASSTYWNPAGLGYMKKNEFQAMIQPWFADINTSFVSLGYVAPDIGTFGVSLIYLSYGQEMVTTVESQEGTGEMFDGADLSFGISYGRKLTDWFSFGTTFKYISSRIWHETAQAVAMDLGAIVNTEFLSWDNEPGSGLNIGMSISNYGSKMTFDGIDTKQSIDRNPEDEGDYKYVPARYELQSWELPLIFRLGISFKPLVIENQQLVVSVDALHPNNNSESINLGGEYRITVPSFGVLNMRGGYKALFMNDSEFGMSLGLGAEIFYLGNKSLKIDYAFREMGVLGYINSYTFSLRF
jgi:hypothetical protein